jgi:hypothetical protein
MVNELIIIEEYARKAGVETEFIILLEDAGLITIVAESGEKYFPASQLHLIEKYARLYYDLSVNVEGIDVIHHLLEKMEEMKREIIHLRNQLG